MTPLPQIVSASASGSRGRESGTKSIVAEFADAPSNGLHLPSSMDSSQRVERLLRSATIGIEEEARALLEPLHSYDAAHNGDLFRTLRAYLMLAGNASATAEVLFLHRSGLLYRLRRIEALLGFGLDVFEHRAAVEIAIIALEMTSQR